ncbi:General secretion pathway protein D [Vibrio nigripulchritudo MADA3029]|uniref:General secretion pathway protein D n=1 Tax=Vibrio nigripulchritudo SOn1 TaxID=1238450 RepID=A0AAV2VR54_9VIBR|nr:MULTISPECIES: type II secretion system secretin GspD [Vibrio]EGU57304.1 general secretion pathway protein D [Vibrio nigripulchritudo ATCC 27043]KJY67501.1 general secretion pathway protein GspD [Vibrio nigripulchritudo]UAB70209.1 type II secretion system secretin GspD [Vibrio sp. SCSIO 43132]CCN36721.1 General secretion pathway protein D [Vibrio nigripulchritudo AM115]CCN41624.1 General secretion pathway protein D [Vibrio nigripulchritudo FTn2]
MKQWLNKGTWLLAGSLAWSPALVANEFSASFKGTDIKEFINIVGRNLEKTIIVDPAIRGKIDVRSYDVLNEEQYYHFFLNVLEVYGFAAVEMENGVLKIVRDKDAKTAAIPVVGDETRVQGDAVITRVVAVRNVSVRELSPLLRQLNDNAGAGNVVHYDPANIILITGRAAVVNRLAEIIERVDRAGDKEIEVVELKNASAAEMVRIVEALNKSTAQKNTPAFLEPKLVADERTNSILISGDPQVRKRLRKLIMQLDVEMATKGNNRVVYLKYAKAEDLVDVLKGVSDNLQAEKQGGAQGAASAKSRNEVMISAHPGTNALVVTAPPDIMRAIEDVIAQLDIRRAQVLIEAMIVELAEGDGANLGVQWGNLNTGAVIQYSNSGASIGSVMVGLEEAKDTTEKKPIRDSDTGAIKYYEETTTKGDYSTLAKALGGVNGAALSLMAGDWTALVSAVASDTSSNILSSPSITVMDNGEASFIVGEEVPVLTGSAAGSNNDNPFSTVERKEVGIKLKVVPQINEGDSVQLTIEQEVSNVLGANGAVDVRFAKRQLNTSVMIQDGQMLVLGGLIDERALESEAKVPLLGDIPVLGHLFKSTSTQVEKKNLMVFIKPTIIRDGVTADGISQRKYNYIRAEQLLKAEEGLKLLSDEFVPVLPKYGEDIRHPEELRAFIEQLEAK